MVGPGQNAERTLEIASFLKSLAPNTLVIDGTFGIHGWESAVLDSRFVDVVSSHYYPLPFSEIYSVPLKVLISLLAFLLLVEEYLLWKWRMTKKEQQDEFELSPVNDDSRLAVAGHHA
jgi:hypothetical protein